MNLSDIDKSFLIDRQGKTFILYAGLLHEAHKAGLMSIQTEAVNVSPEFALFKAIVSMSDAKTGIRVYEGHGDASADNVGRNIAPHFIRMAETRAKARALRDALDVGAAAVEELADDDDHPTPRPQPRPQQRQEVPPAQQRVEDDAAWNDLQCGSNGARQAPTPIHQPQGSATEAQVRAIYGIGKKNGLDRTDVQREAVKIVGKPPEELTKREASDLITALQGA